MENKIQELTDKIYREGVEKGNEEARKIRSHRVVIDDDVDRAQV